MAKVRGSIWVEGDALHYVDSGTTEYYIIGTNKGSAGAGISGSIWLEDVGWFGTDRLRYVDASGNIRELSTINTYGTHGTLGAPGAAIAGSLWMDDTGSGQHQLRYIDAGQMQTSPHDDVAFGDVSHSDVAHTDTTTHNDSVAHGDDHDDDHSDGGPTHSDDPFGDGGPGEGHGGHNDHTDDHSDETISSSHTDTSTHTDSSGHADVAHTDVPHADATHADQPIYVGA